MYFAFSISNNTHGLLRSRFMSRHETLPHTLKFVGRSVAWRHKEQLRRRLVRHQKDEYDVQQRMQFYIYIQLFVFECRNILLSSVVTRIRTIKLCCSEMIKLNNVRPPLPIGNLSNGDGNGDGNENGEKAIGLDWQNNKSACVSRFLVLSFCRRSLHNYDVKLPRFQVLWWRTLTQGSDFLFLFRNLDTVL